MPENTGEVKAFQFDKDSFEEMKDIYKEILDCFGVKDLEARIAKDITPLEEGDRNGLMFNKMVSDLFATPQERKDKASKVFEKIKNTKISPYVKAYIAEMAGDYIPYDTVLTSARMVGGERGKNGKSLQMGCGEGKTGVLSMAAYAILQQNSEKQVFITSSTENLAAEALDKINFYDKVGLAKEVVLVDSKGITRPSIKNGKVERDNDKNIVFERIELDKLSPKVIKEKLAEAYKSRLVISDNVTLMQDAMKGYLPEPTKGNQRELLADEADFVLLDSYRPLQRTTEMSTEEMKKTAEMRQTAYRILENVKKQKKEGLFVKDDSSQYVDFTKEGRALVVEAIKSTKKSLKTDWNELYDYVYDALVVDTVYKENRDYQILNEGQKIVSEDRASGVGIDLPEGVKQALEIKLQSEGKYNGEISPERKVLDTLNTQSFFRKYFNGTKHFVSGTLGVNSKAIIEELKNFDVKKEEGDIYEAPPKEKRSREDRKRKFLRNETRKRKAVIESALEEIDKDRPVLIGTVSEAEIKALKELLDKKFEETGKNVRVLEFTAASEEIYKQDLATLNNTQFREKYGVDISQYKDYKTLIKNESGRVDTITLGTSILGRGTTIKTTDRVNHNGGIHVIIDGLHETSSRNQEQYKARTARGDNSGSTQEFFCEKDIPEELRRESYKGISHDEIYNEVYENIDARTSAIRNYVVQFVEETVQKLNEIDETPKMSEAYKEQAKALLTQRAFSIKNRACGVSDKFQSNIEEYKREIEAYAALYVAKYKVTDKEYLTNEGRFDEAKWLSKNGYPDVAKTHIPFRRKTEQEIFKKNNIKESKRKEEPISKLKVEQKPEVPKQTESEKITTEEFDQAIPEDKREEIIVADIARGIEAKESEENKTLEETAELKTENLEFNKKSAYAQLSNWGRMSIKKIQEKLGIKTMIWDLKNSRNLRTSAVQNCYSELKDAIKEQENMKENNVGEATKNQDETSER